MKKIKEKKLFIFLAIVLVFFGTLAKLNFSVDTYLLFASKNLSYIAEYERSGRFLTAWLFKFMGLFHLSESMMYVTSFVLAVTFLTLSIYTLYSVLDKYIKNSIINGIISVAIVINPFIIELWLFVEMGIMMLSIYACVMAFKLFDDYLETKRKNKIVKSMVFMILALFSYQGTVAIFISLTILTIFKNSKDIREFIKNTILSFLCYGIPTIINFLIVMIIGNSRVGVEHDLVRTLGFILSVTGERLITGFGMYPRGIYTVLNILTILIAFFVICSSKKQLKEKLILCTKIVYMVLMTYVFTILVIVPQDVSQAVMFPRNSYAFASIIGLVFSTILLIIDESEENIFYAKAQKIMAGILLIMMVMEFWSFTKIAINRYSVNYLDKYIALEIERKIEEYEAETGYKVRNIALYNVENSTKFLPDLDDRITVSARSEELSSLALMVYYTKRELNKVDADDTISSTYFENKNWDMFDMDQIVIEGNTLHWYLY